MGETTTAKQPFKEGSAAPLVPLLDLDGIHDAPRCGASGRRHGRRGRRASNLERSLTGDGTRGAAISIEAELQPGDGGSLH